MCLSFFEFENKFCLETNPTTPKYCCIPPRCVPSSFRSQSSYTCSDRLPRNVKPSSLPTTQACESTTRDPTRRLQESGKRAARRDNFGLLGTCSVNSLVILSVFQFRASQNASGVSRMLQWFRSTAQRRLLRCWKTVSVHRIRQQDEVVVLDTQSSVWSLPLLNSFLRKLCPSVPYPISQNRCPSPTPSFFF